MKYILFFYFSLLLLLSDAAIYVFAILFLNSLEFFLNLQNNKTIDEVETDQFTVRKTIFMHISKNDRRIFSSEAFHSEEIL